MAKAALLNAKKLREKLTEAGRLKLRPLCVYGTGEIPEGAVPSYEISTSLTGSRNHLASFRFQNTFLLNV
jgi:hypothetical protein